MDYANFSFLPCEVLVSIIKKKKKKKKQKKKKKKKAKY